jgi:hypothetical protein
MVMMDKYMMVLQNHTTLKDEVQSPCSEENHTTFEEKVQSPCSEENHTPLEEKVQSPCSETYTTSCDASHAIFIKVEAVSDAEEEAGPEEVSDAEEEEDPLPITFPKIEADPEVRCMSLYVHYEK